MVGARAGRARGGLSLKLHILAIGRLKRGPEKLLADDYIGRAGAVGRACGIAAVIVRELLESRRKSEPERLGEEGENFISVLPPKSFTVVLDERGKALNSPAFADLVRHHRDRGDSDLAFLIGGPDGHGQAIRESAGLVLSLGMMTWPHRLVRVMLAEQIYRAVTILVNHPYHRP